MPNPSGKNGSSNGIVPSDDVLNSALLEFAKERLPLRQRLGRLQKQFGYTIGITKLKELNNKFNIPSARKCSLPFDQTNQAVIDQVAQDVGGNQGPETIRSRMALDGIIVPRRIVRQIMHANWDDKFDHRYLGGRQKRQCGHLTAFGPWQEIHGDGHEKLGAAALRMGGVGIPAYGFRDKWTGAPIRLVVIPNARLATTIAHVYLDMVEDYNMIVQHLTVDKGSETADMGAFQLALRQQFAPDLSLEEFPGFCTLPSTNNVVIEGFWRWLRQDCGMNLYTMITDGYKHGIYNIANRLHEALFYWLWPPIVQTLFDDFYQYWITHRVKHQANKLMPSGVSPKELYINPEAYGGRPMGISITNRDVIDGLRDSIGITREEAFRWISDEFQAAADKVYAELGSPSCTALNAWDIFQLMLPGLSVQEPESLHFL